MSKHDDLITYLSDRPSAETAMMSPERFYLVAMPIWGGAVIAIWLAILYQAGSGIRPDYFSLIANPLIAMKQIVPLAIIMVGVPLLLLLMRPEGNPGRAIAPFLAILAIFPLMMAIVLIGHSWLEMSVIITSQSLYQCAATTILLALAMTFGEMLVLRRGAVTRPYLTGGIAGIIGGGFAALIYAPICVEDNPGFYGLWYSIGIFTSGGIGALLGHKMLRW